MGLWVDSYWKGTAIRLSWREEGMFQGNRVGEFDNIEVCSSRGLIVVWKYESLSSSTDVGLQLITRPDHYFSGHQWDKSFLGFGTSSYGLKLRHYATPHWFLTLLLAILPAVWLIKWRKRRKLGPNACSSCGYDLTGNETRQCPECGVEADTAQTTT